MSNSAPTSTEIYHYFIDEVGLIQNRNIEQLKSASEAPQSEALTDYLLAHPDPEARVELAKCRKLSSIVIDALLSDPYPSIHRELVRHFELSESQLLTLAAGNDASIGFGLIERTSLPDSVIARLAKSDSGFVRKVTPLNKKDISNEVLQILALDLDLSVKAPAITALGAAYFPDNPKQWLISIFGIASKTLLRALWLSKSVGDGCISWIVGAALLFSRRFEADHSSLGHLVSGLLRPEYAESRAFLTAFPYTMFFSEGGRMSLFKRMSSKQILEWLTICFRNTPASTPHEFYKRVYCLSRIIKTFDENESILQKTLKINDFSSLDSLESKISERLRPTDFDTVSLNQLENFLWLLHLNGNELPSGYKVHVLRDTKDLWQVGQTLRNCAFKYKEKVIRGDQALIWLEQSGVVKFLVEIVDGVIEQAKGYSNAHMPPAQKYELSCCIETAIDKYKATQASHSAMSVDSAHLPQAQTSSPMEDSGAGIANFNDARSLASHLIQIRERDLQEEADKSEALTTLDRLALEVGPMLIRLIDPQNVELDTQIRKVRRESADKLGFLPPQLKLRENAKLKPDEYCILMNGHRVARGLLMADSLLAINQGDLVKEVQGLPALDPVCGLPALWIHQWDKDAAESCGYVVSSCEEIIAIHMTKVLQENAAELLTHQDVQGLVYSLRRTDPMIVDHMIGFLGLSLTKLTNILRNLLRENVSIRDLRSIFECLADHAVLLKSWHHSFLSELCRRKLGPAIVQSFTTEKDELMVVSFDSELERVLQDALVSFESGGSYLNPPTSIAQDILQKLLDALTVFEDDSLKPVLLISASLRLPFQTICGRYMPQLAVIAYLEIPANVEIQNLRKISLSTEQES